MTISGSRKQRCPVRDVRATDQNTQVPIQGNWDEKRGAKCAHTVGLSSRVYLHPEDEAAAKDCRERGCAPAVQLLAQELQLLHRKCCSCCSQQFVPVLSGIRRTCASEESCPRTRVVLINWYLCPLFSLPLLGKQFLLQTG